MPNSSEDERQRLLYGDPAAPEPQGLVYRWASIGSASNADSLSPADQRRVDRALQEARMGTSDDTDSQAVEAMLNERAAARAAYDRAVEAARQRALLAGCPAADEPHVVAPPQLSTWDQAEGE